MSEIKGLMSTMAKKWKLEQIPNKKLELENRLMEERLNQLKNELSHERQKRSAFGGTVWTKASPGPIKNYGKTSLKSADSKPNEDSPKLTHKQMKLRMLKDEIITVKNEMTAASNNSSRNGSGIAANKKQKCGQCEKAQAFTRCLECGEDYCANCFTNFHLKGALQKHRTVPILNDELARLKMPIINSEFQSHFTPKNSSILRPGSGNKDACAASRQLNRDSAPSSTLSSAKNQNHSLLDGTYNEQESHEAFKQALLEWRNQSNGNGSNRRDSQASRSETGHTTNRDAIIGNDEPIDSFRSPNQEKFKKAFEKLDERIRTNSDLSYADRLLLNKYRREGASSRSDSRNSSQLSRSHSGKNVINHFRTGGSVSQSLTDSTSTLTDYENVDENERISFTSIMRALNIPESTDEVRPSNASESVIIEEISTMSLDIKKPRQLIEATFEIKKPTEIITSENEPQKSPVKRDDIILNKSKTESEFKMSREATNRSVKVKSAAGQKPAPKDAVSMSLNPGKTQSKPQTIAKEPKVSSSLTASALTRTPSKTLQAISNRQVDQKEAKIVSENTFNSSIFMINVDSQDKPSEPANPDSSRASSARKSSDKITFSLSSKFYEMSPKSWRPSSSLSVDLAEETESKATTERPVSTASTLKQSSEAPIKKSQEVKTSTSKSTTSMRLSQKLEKSLKTDPSKTPSGPAKSPAVAPAKKDSFMIKIPKNAQTRAKTELNLKKEKTAATSQGTKLALNKSVTFIGKEKKGPDSFRPKSAITIKLEAVGNQIDRYDADGDGRSSRICQNDEDNQYFGDLVTEFKKSVHRMAAGLKDDAKKDTVDPIVGEINEKLLQDSLSILEMTLTRDAVEHDEFADQDNWESESVEVSNLK